MTLHFRKLLIASIAFPVVVVCCMAVLLPSLMQARSSAAFGQMRTQIKTLEMQVETLDAINDDDALTAPLQEMRETLTRQQETLIDLREALLDQKEPVNGPGWIALISGCVGILGTLSSLVLSWRQDMREVRSEMARSGNVHAAGDVGASAA